ncbi:MAG: HAD family phosphatase [Ruminococcus sp.]|nr:HAD family phosphatase [Ruminococcus sp.]
MIKGVIFDLDGTLIDSMKIWYGIDREFLRENGVTTPPEDISDRMKTMSVDESSQYFIDFFGLDLTKEYVIKRIEELVRVQYEQNIQLKPFVHDALDFLDKIGIRYGVATATYKGLAEAVLRRCGIIDRFAFLLTDIEYPMGKRQPDIYLGGAERLGCKPDETLVIEDSLHCIETSVNAGFITAGIYDAAADADKQRIIELSDFYLDSLDELKNIFK